MTTINLLFVLISWTNTFAIANARNDWRNYKLRGQVRSFSVSIHEAEVNPPGITAGNLINEVFLGSGTKIEKHRTVFFNEIGNLTEERFFNDEGLQVETVTYDYDDWGNKIAQTWYNERGDVFLKWTASYEDQIVEETWSNTYGQQKERITYEYDSTQNLLNERHFGPQDKLFAISTYYYNGKGKVRTIETTDLAGDVLEKIDFEYDAAGNRTGKKDHEMDTGEMQIMKANFDVYGRQTSVFWSHTQYGFLEEWHFDYNEFDLVAASKQRPRMGEPEERIFQYTYDNQGNWTEMMVFINGKAAYIAKRQLTYF